MTYLWLTFAVPLALAAAILVRRGRRQIMEGADSASQETGPSVGSPSDDDRYKIALSLAAAEFGHMPEYRKGGFEAYLRDLRAKRDGLASEYEDEGLVRQMRGWLDWYERKALRRQAEIAERARLREVAAGMGVRI